MHDSRKVFLLEEEPRCIKATYEMQKAGTAILKSYEFKTFDKDILVDDYIVVPTDTRHNMTVVKVVEVDVEPNLDTENHMHWVIGRVELVGYEATLKSEEGFIDVARAAEKRRRKEQLKQDFLADVDSKIRVIAGPSK